MNQDGDKELFRENWDIASQRRGAALRQDKPSDSSARENAPHRDAPSSKRVPVSGGNSAAARGRAFLFQRASWDCWGRMLWLDQFRREICTHLKDWFWTGPGSRAWHWIIQGAVVVSGLLLGGLYLTYELQHSRGLSGSSALALGVIGGYVSILMWGWKMPVHVAARAGSTVCIVGSVGATFLVAGFVAVMIFAFYVLSLFVLTAASCAVFIPVRFAHWCWLVRWNIAYRCPYDSCASHNRRRGHLPIHVCSCGREYADLYPNFFGVFYHTCDHGDHRVKLPTLDWLGRNKLKRLCGECKREFKHTATGLKPVRPVLMVGGADTGKTVFLLQAMRWLTEHFNQDRNRICLGGDIEQRSLKLQWDRLGSGQTVAKTIGQEMVALGLDIDVESPQRVNCLVHFYDLPGEHYSSMENMSRMQVLRNIEGIVLVVDPFASAPLRDAGRRMGRGLKPSDKRLYDVVSQLIQTINLARPEGVDTKCAVPVAVVINKVDALNGQEHAHLEHLISSNGSPGAANANCRKALEHIEGDSVRLLEHKFSNVQYFGCSALGRIPDDNDPAPFEPLRVDRPLCWLLDLEEASSQTTAQKQSCSVPR